MEPEVREFFQRISLSIGIVVVWMTINITAGIFFDLAFIHGSISIGNILFYVWFAVSVFFVIKLYLRVWRKKL